MDNLAIYQAKNGAIELKSDYDKETIWANLNQISDLFGRDKSIISRHIQNIFTEKELQKDSTVAFFATVQKEGSRTVTRDIEYFNLDLIVSIGYRVNSKIATKFRKWATKILKQHITKEFTINKKRIQYNCEEFLSTIEDVKLLAKNNLQVLNIN